AGHAAGDNVAPALPEPLRRSHAVGRELRTGARDAGRARMARPPRRDAPEPEDPSLLRDETMERQRLDELTRRTLLKLGVSSAALLALPWARPRAAWADVANPHLLVTFFGDGGWD